MEDDKAHIFRVPFMGGEPQKISDMEWDIAQSFTPDGKSLIVLAHNGKNFNVGTVPPTGGEITFLTQKESGAFNVVCSPLGDRIAFLANNNGRNDLFLVPVAGGSMTQLTRTAGAEGSPFWSPDGEYLVCPRKDSDADLVAILVAE
jgi:Tol biopolymer transport system component